MAIVKYVGDRFAGLSSDTKPTNVQEGALFFEIDTGLIYGWRGGEWEQESGLIRQGGWESRNDDTPDWAGYALFRVKHTNGAEFLFGKYSEPGYADSYFWTYADSPEDYVHSSVAAYTGDISTSGKQFVEIFALEDGLSSRASLRSIRDGITRALILHEQGYDFASAAPVRLPRLTTTQRDALTPANGDTIYNTTVNEFQTRKNGVWRSMHQISQGGWESEAVSSPSGLLIRGPDLGGGERAQWAFYYADGYLYESLGVLNKGGSDHYVARSSDSANHYAYNELFENAAGVPRFTIRLGWVAGETVVSWGASGRTDFVFPAPLRHPRMTTTQRDAFTAENGDTLYNTTANRLQVREGGAWRNIETSAI